MRAAHAVAGSDGGSSHAAGVEAGFALMAGDTLGMSCIVGGGVGEVDPVLNALFRPFGGAYEGAF